MKRRQLRRGRIVFAGALALVALPVLRSEDLPPAAEVIKKVIERAKQDSAQHYETRYTYSVHNVIEELDEKGSVKQRKERLYEVVTIDGGPFYKLMQKDGKPLTEEDRKHELERERKFRQTLAERSRKKVKSEVEVELNEELFGKYKVEIVDRETVKGRPALVASFEPKRSDLPAKRRIDFLLNKLAGKVWIDDQDYEIVKAQFHLTEPVAKFMGLLASVRRFDAWFEQTRLDDGVWFPSLFENYFEGRILFKSLHQRTQQQWSAFRKVSQEAGKPRGE